MAAHLQVVVLVGVEVSLHIASALHASGQSVLGKVLMSQLRFPCSTHIIVDAPAPALSRLHVIDTASDKVDEAVAHVALQPIDVVPRTGRNEVLGRCKLAVLLVIGEEDELGSRSDRLGNVFGVVPQRLADRCC